MSTEIQNHADFSRIRYAQCWEDADILCEALRCETFPRCISIGSAGDNSFALLAKGASHVTAVEMNPAQIACIELRKAAYMELDYQNFLQLLGVKPCDDRLKFYESCKHTLSPQSRKYWDHHQETLAQGSISAGKFENYFALFRNKVLPLAHTKKRIKLLLEEKTLDQRKSFYTKRWNNLRWRLIFQVFFSRFTMGRLGRDPAFFQYVEGSVASRILERTKHALVELDPSHNPYLHFILKGNYSNSLPLALREDAFHKIKVALLENEDCFRIIHAPLEKALDQLKDERFDAFNLSDIFEYMNEENTESLFKQILNVSSTNTRIAYWNMLAPRSRPESLADSIQYLEEASDALFLQDKAFFYSRFLIDEVL